MQRKNKPAHKQNILNYTTLKEYLTLLPLLRISAELANITQNPRNSPARNNSQISPRLKSHCFHRYFQPASPLTVQIRDRRKDCDNLSFNLIANSSNFWNRSEYPKDKTLKKYVHSRFWALWHLYTFADWPIRPAVTNNHCWSVRSPPSPPSTCLLAMLSR